MDRVETNVGSEIYEWWFSQQAQNDMVGLAKLCGALFGTSGFANGLACTQTTVPSMQVSIGYGELYQMASLEATVCGTLPANTTDQILKQGILLGSAAPYNVPSGSVFTAPTTAGQSINYLIEAQYQDSDVSLDPTTGNSPVVLNFYNSTNPSTPWSGPNNSGASSNTFRKGTIAFQVKAGSAATTGTQTTPNPDTGWLGLYVITVPYGATSLTSTNIATYSGAPFLGSPALLNKVNTFTQLQAGVTPAQFDNSTNLATTAFIQQALGNASPSAWNNVSASGTIPITKAGQYFNIGTGGTTQTINVSGLPVGSRFSFIANYTGTGVSTLAVTGGGTFNAPSASLTATCTFLAGEMVTVMYTGGAAFVVENHCAAVRYLYGDSSNVLFTANGFVKLPGGAILQWATVTLTGSSPQNFSWPINFNSILWGSATANGYMSAYYGLQGLSTSGAQLAASVAFAGNSFFVMGIGR